MIVLLPNGEPLRWNWKRGCKACSLKWRRSVIAKTATLATFASGYLVLMRRGSLLFCSLTWPWRAVRPVLPEFPNQATFSVRWDSMRMQPQRSFVFLRHRRPERARARWRYRDRQGAAWGERV